MTAKLLLENAYQTSIDAVVTAVSDALIAQPGDASSPFPFDRCPAFEVEAKLVVSMAKTGIYPAAVEYLSRLAACAAGMKGLKIRVPDVPAYTATPKACGANPTPIAFAEVYLALQNGTVEAQENPLTTIEAKKFFEVQKNIILTGHISDALLTVISPSLMGTHWQKLGADRSYLPTVLLKGLSGAIKVNGQPYEAEDSLTAAVLVERLGYAGRRLALDDG